MLNPCCAPCRGYGSKYRTFAKALKDRYPDVSVSGEATPGATGAFEVTVNGQLVHSKKTKGQGFVDNPQKMQAVIDAIEAAIAKQAA